MIPWIIVSAVLFFFFFYLGIRVYRLRKGLYAVLDRLQEIERKVPVLKP